MKNTREKQLKLRFSKEKAKTTTESLPSNLGKMNPIHSKELASLIIGCKTLGFTAEEAANYVFDHTNTTISIHALRKLSRHIYAG